jgi:hypothetical protein
MGMLFESEGHKWKDTFWSLPDWKSSNSLEQGS